jgi:hypothetical protein
MWHNKDFSIIHPFGVMVNPTDEFKAPRAGSILNNDITHRLSCAKFRVHTHIIPPLDYTWASWIQLKSARPVIMPKPPDCFFRSAKSGMWRRVFGWLAPDVSEIKEIRSFETSGATHSTTRLHIPEDENHQQQWHKNFKSLKARGFISPRRRPRVYLAKSTNCEAST